MHLLSAILLTPILHSFALERKSPSRVAVTPHVLTLETAPFRYPLTPSSSYLAQRFNTTLIPRQDDDPILAEIQQQLLTFGGRVYMTNISVATRPYTLVIDTGSSDTWLASSSFNCVSRLSRVALPQSACGFGTLYDIEDSETYTKIEGYGFGVSYTDGEFLSGEMGVEVLGVSGLAVRQVIGVVETGWWMGDRVSSGLLGLAYSALASNARNLNYTSIVFSLFEDDTVPPIFSLALSRPTRINAKAGGLLAIGGIPDIPYHGDFVSVPIIPMAYDTFAFYSIPIDGFTVLPANYDATPSRILSRRNKTHHSSTLLSTPVNMVIDSGTTMMYVPDYVAEYIAGAFDPPAVYSPTNGVYMAPCGATPPKVGVRIGGRTFWVDARDLYLVPGKDAGKSARPCVVAVQRQGTGDPVLGDAFLKNVIAVFDLGVNEMRFTARKKY